LDCGAKVGGEEGYQVLVGGGSDERQGLGRELISQFALQICRRSWRGSSGRFSDAHGDESFLDSREGTGLNN